MLFVLAEHTYIYFYLLFFSTSGTYESQTLFLAWGSLVGAIPSPLCRRRMHSWRIISSNVYVFLCISQETSTCQYSHAVMKATAAPSRCLQQTRMRRRKYHSVSSPMPEMRKAVPFLGGLTSTSRALWESRKDTLSPEGSCLGMCGHVGLRVHMCVC